MNLYAARADCVPKSIAAQCAFCRNVDTPSSMCYFRRALRNANYCKFSTLPFERCSKLIRRTVNYDSWRGIDETYAFDLVLDDTFYVGRQLYSLYKTRAAFQQQ